MGTTTKPFLRTDYLACMDNAGGVTSEMLDCIGAEMKRQDAQLNENYKTLMSKVSKKRKGELQEAQPLGSNSVS
jgi:uncharacterized protein YecT (DUF1311 family)